MGLSHAGSAPATHYRLWRVYSVYDGAVLHTHAAPCERAPQHAVVGWAPHDAGPAPSQALDMLHALPPLPPVPDVPSARPGWLGAAPARPRAAEPLPSAAMASGRGVLAQLPALPEARTPGTSLLLCADDDDGVLHLWLDGTVYLGGVPLGAAGCVVSLAADGADVSAWVHAPTAPLLVQVRRLSAAPALRQARLATALRACLAQMQDAACVAARAWTALARPQAVQWQHHWDDVARRHGADVVLDGMALVMTGRASPACEQLLAQLTEGTTLAMETEAKRALKHIRRVLAVHFQPACERALVVWHEWHGCALARGDGLPPLPPPSPPSPLLACHAVGVALQEEAERELLALDEYYQWWRMEQDRQERRKLGEDAPRVVTYHDTLAVLELLQRGFVAPALDALLGTDDAGARRAPAPTADESDDSAALLAPLWPARTAAFSGAPASSDAAASSGDGASRDAATSSDAPTAPPADWTAALDDAAAWLAHAPPVDHRPAPTAAQWRGVLGDHALWAGPAHTYRPRTLPGDACLLTARVDAVGRELAAVCSAALEGLVDATVTAHEVVAPAAPLCRSDAVVSVPAEAPAALAADGAAVPLARAGATPAGHVHVLAGVSSVDVWHGRAGAAPRRTTHAVRGAVRDVACAGGAAHVLYDDGAGAGAGVHLAALGTPAVAAAGDAARVAALGGAFVLLGADGKALTSGSYVPTASP